MTHYTNGSGGQPQVEQLHSLHPRRDMVAETRSVGLSVADPLCASLVDQLDLCIEMRRLRKTHFGSIEITGPTWDMLLDLMRAASQGRDLSASDLATGADVPLSSGLRMIATLEEADLVRRSIDARDRRRSLVHLTDRGFERMTSYFERLRFERQRNDRSAA